MASSSDTEHGESVDYGSGDAGNGLSQLDVVALDIGRAAILNLPYAPDAQGAMRQLSGGGSDAPVGCGDFWCSPDVLANVPDQAADGLTVLRLPYAVEGKTYQAVRFDFNSDAVQIALIYDLDTGVLLYHTFDYGSFNTNDQSRILSSWSKHAIYKFINLRQIELPWKDGIMPSSFSPGQSMSYQGQTSIQVQGAAPVVTYMTLNVDVLSAQERFADLKTDTYDQSTGSTSTGSAVSGVAQLMGNWIPEGAASSLSPGVIDSDPYTGMQVSLVKNDEDGAIFEKTNQKDFRELFAYDQSGVLVEAYYEYNPDVVTSAGFGSVKVIDLQLVK
jgi:hypothetical protein